MDWIGPGKEERQNGDAEDGRRRALPLLIPRMLVILGESGHCDLFCACCHSFALSIEHFPLVSWNNDSANVRAQIWLKDLSCIVLFPDPRSKDQ